MSIKSDEEFKAALSGLTLPEQRRIAARFIEHVAGLTEDPRITAAITAALHRDISDKELAMAVQAARSAHVESYTQCGSLGDWKCQAGHFVAKAALSCVSPVESGHNLAWDAAMHARMARTCDAIAQGQGTEHHEATAQYRILEDLLKH
jgi:hypothetical protein